MKRLLILLITLFASIGTIYAENIIIGDKTPRLRLQAWLMDMQPEEADFTCILFHNSESALCRQCLDEIKDICSKFAPQLHLIIITKESYSDAGVTLTSYLSDYTSVGFDERGRTFRAFGVKFIPFCVIIDNKHRTAWCGNGASLSEPIIEKILTTKTK